MLHLLGLGRQDDRVTWADQAGARFEEQDRDLTDVNAVLLGVRLVVAPDTDDLAGKDRGQS
jgi:hypothetical protein